LKVVTCKCANCGEEKEIFSDEFGQTHVCDSCGKKIFYAMFLGFSSLVLDIILLVCLLSEYQIKQFRNS
jgi:DNA-directed RNA polymerase subunit RPC12/RpoP